MSYSQTHIAHRGIVGAALCAACIAVPALIGCGGEAQQESAGAAGQSAPTPPAASGPETGGPLTPDPGGKVVPVELITDGDGNYFRPAEAHVKRGDVVRYTLKVGVHNVHFLPDSNAGHTGFPATPSDFLQLPGQTWDVKISMPPGTYYMQCDPHAALGMQGHLIVE